MRIIEFIAHLLIFKPFNWPLIVGDNSFHLMCEHKVDVSSKVHQIGETKIIETHNKSIRHGITQFRSVNSKQLINKWKLFQTCQYISTEQINYRSNNCWTLLCISIDLSFGELKLSQKTHTQNEFVTQLLIDKSILLIHKQLNSKLILLIETRSNLELFELEWFLCVFLVFMDSVFFYCLNLMMEAPGDLM